VPGAIYDVSYSGVTGVEALQPLDAKPESLTQMVYAAIRQAIVSKGLIPGTVVSEASLARRLAVSKTPVREALLRLQAVGLVEPDGMRGLRIVKLSDDVIRQAYEVRMALESDLCRRAAERATATQCQDMAKAAARSLASAEQADTDGFRGWDRRFHRAVADAAASPRLAQLAEDALTLAGVLRERDVPGVQDAIRCARQHLAIAEAIADGDGQAAEDGARQHAEDVGAMVLAAFRQRTSNDPGAARHG
jgi:DNA-binding GntR family transcriptional regulator